MKKTFPFATEEFFNQLKQNNTKEWFENSRERYNSDVLAPAQELVTLLGLEIGRFRPNLQAIPKIDKSIFRLHRDVRFSKDKSPYKTHLGIFLWEGKRKKMECSGLYFHLEPGNYFMATGIYMFPPDLLKVYRKCVAESVKAKELHDIMQRLAAQGNIQLGNKHFKKLPRGFQDEFPQNEYLLYNGLYGMISGHDFQAIEGKQAIEFCTQGFEKMMDLHVWLVENLP